MTDICTEDNDSEDSIVFDENAPLASSTGENIPEKKDEYEGNNAGHKCGEGQNDRCICC